MLILRSGTGAGAKVPFIITSFSKFLREVQSTNSIPKTGEAAFIQT